MFYNIQNDSSKNYVACRNTELVKLIMHVLQLLNVRKSQHNVTHTKLVLHDRMSLSRDSVDLSGVLSRYATLFECLRHNNLSLR